MDDFVEDDVDEAEPDEPVEVEQKDMRGKSPDNPIPIDDAYFLAGPKREKIPARELIITSRVRLPNEKWVVYPDGKKARAAYMSHSSTTAYAKCHMFYHRKYMLGQKDVRPAVNLWTGSAFHNVMEFAGQAKIEGRHYTTEEAVRDVKKHMDGEFAKYDTDSAALIKEGKDPMELKLPARLETREQVIGLAMGMAEAFLETEMPKVTPVSVEKRGIYHMEMKSGGTVPYIYFIDLIEQDDNGLRVTDYKTGRLRTQENLEMDQQLTLYGLAEGIFDVAWYSVKMGTTGGKTPKRAKPPQILKLKTKKTIKDQEVLFEDFNYHLESLAAGNFGRTGLQNSQICGSRLCPFWHDCLGKK
jgi:hypothetical protein